MATATMATAAGAAALLYYTLNKKLQSMPSSQDDDDDDDNVNRRQSNVHLGIHRVSTKLIRAPATWLETISTLSETLRFTYSETLGKWPIGELAFGISFLLKQQGNLQVHSVFGGEDSVQLKGDEITLELRYFLHLLTLCWHFSKKPFPLFLEETGFSQENVLLQEPKAGILKPAFTVLVDHKTKSFLLLIRGTHSIKDTLTAATGAVVPFHHTVVHEGGVSNLVLGYAHGGMVAAARWIAKLATPCLIKELKTYHDYKLKIVGHSLGGSTAALLTYVMREQKELSTASCVTFAPAACMTWDLAESGNEFVTTVINGADLVPTFSAASVDDLRTEVTASAWVNDLKSKIERTTILSTVYHSASALGSRLPSIASARARVAGAGAILRPVSTGTQVVMRRAQTMARAAWSHPSIELSSWSCMGPRRRPTTTRTRSNVGEYSLESSSGKSETFEPLVISSKKSIAAIELPVSSEATVWSSQVECSSSNEQGLNCENDVDYSDDLVGPGTLEDSMTEVELWQQLEHELYDQPQGEGDDLAKEMREEEAEAICKMSERDRAGSLLNTREVHRFLPPGKIMHIVTLVADELEGETDSGTSTDSGSSQQEQAKIGIFLTSRSLYSKLRLSRTMIADHFMPVYRRQIEKLIAELQKERTEAEVLL